MNADKNTIQSIKQRLKNLSVEKKIDYDYLLLVYMNEGLLRRLQASRFIRNFILKGGFLLSSILNNLGRTTRDLDFLGKKIGNDASGVEDVFRDICSIHEDDCLIFLTEKLEAIEIKEDNVYPGIRVTVPCLPGRSKHKLQFDIGFGDTITPHENEYDLSSIFHGKPINLFVYPLESIIAEKFEAMITLGEINSRMKDFYDLFIIFKNYRIDFEILAAAIRNTIHSRKTTCPENPAVFSDQFYSDPARMRMWSRFLNRAGIKDDLPFQEILVTMKQYLEPIYSKFRKL